MVEILTDEYASGERPQNAVVVDILALINGAFDEGREVGYFDGEQEGYERGYEDGNINGYSDAMSEVRQAKEGMIKLLDSLAT